MSHGWSENKKERCWKADMFRHKIFENQTKIDGVLTLTINDQNHHCTSPFRSQLDLRWCLHWIFWKILIVKTITPSILVHLCINISAFHDLSFSFSDQPCGMCPSDQKCVLGPWKKKSQKLKKWTIMHVLADFFFTCHFLDVEEA